MGATTTTLSTAIQKYFTRMAETLDYQGTPLLNQIKKVPSVSGNSIDWKNHYGGNSTSTTFSEGDVPSATGNETYVDCTIAASGGYVRTMHGITGHAKDAMKNGYFDGASKEAEGAIRAHRHYEEDLVVTAHEAAIDSAGNYGGVSRATYKMASYEAAVTPTLAELQTMWQTQMALEIAWDPSVQIIRSGSTFLFAYLDVATGIQYFEFPSVVNGVVDAGKLSKMPAYNGRPIMTVPTMTVTTATVVNPADEEIVEFRPITTDEYAKSDDSDTIALTSCKRYVHYNTKMAAKLT